MRKKAGSTPAGTAGETNGSAERGINNRLKQMREERRWTQWQLAKIARLSERTIQRIERGARPGVTAEMALAAAFGVEISELYENSTSPSVVDFIFLKRLVSGPAILDLCENTGQLGFQIDRLKEIEIDLVMDFIETLSMLVGMWKDMDQDDQVKSREILSSKIERLDARGFWVFGGCAREKLPEGPEMEVARLAIVRLDNPRIMQPKSLSGLGNKMCGVVVELDQWYRIVSPLRIGPGLEVIREVIAREIV